MGFHPYIWTVFDYQMSKSQQTYSLTDPTQVLNHNSCAPSSCRTQCPSPTLACASRPSGRRLLSRAHPPWRIPFLSPCSIPARLLLSRLLASTGRSSPACSPAPARAMLHPFRHQAPCATMTVAHHDDSSTVQR
jgi:hypothetical protein